MCQACELLEEMEEKFGVSTADDADELNPAGRNRPVRRLPDDSKSDRAGKLGPVPWLGGAYPFVDQWARIDVPRATEAENDKLCIVCGKSRGDRWLYMVAADSISDRRWSAFGELIGSEIPAPTVAHPNCGLQAALYCPHLSAQSHPAVLPDARARLSKEALHELATLDRKLEKDETLTEAEKNTEYHKLTTKLRQRDDTEWFDGNIQL